MTGWLTPQEIERVATADSTAFRSPIPTQMVSNGEFSPIPQTDEQRRVENRLATAV